jgi:hypothetical protein
MQTFAIQPKPLGINGLGSLASNSWPISLHSHCICLTHCITACCCVHLSCNVVCIHIRQLASIDVSKVCESVLRTWERRLDGKYGVKIAQLLFREQAAVYLLDPLYAVM